MCRIAPIVANKYNLLEKSNDRIFCSNFEDKQNEYEQIAK